MRLTKEQRIEIILIAWSGSSHMVALNFNRKHGTNITHDINELSKLSHRAAQQTDYKRNVNYFVSQSKLRLSVLGPVPYIYCHGCAQTCLITIQTPSHWCWIVLVMRAQMRLARTLICECGAFNQTAPHVKLLVLNDKIR